MPVVNALRADQSLYHFRLDFLGRDPDRVSSGWHVFFTAVMERIPGSLVHVGQVVGGDVPTKVRQVPEGGLEQDAALAARGEMPLGQEMVVHLQAHTPLGIMQRVQP